MCARHNHSQSNIKSLKNHKESHSKHFCCPCSSHLAHCFDRSVPLFPMSELISSDEEVQVEWNKTALQTGLRTIHNEPGASSFSSSRILDSVCFALAKPVETGPCPEAQDSQDYAGQSDGPGLGSQVLQDGPGVEGHASTPVDSQVQQDPILIATPVEFQLPDPKRRAHLLGGQACDGDAAPPAVADSVSPDTGHPIGAAASAADVCSVPTLPEADLPQTESAKRQKLLADPKFKKGTRMGDLSPESQKTLMEARRLRKIENSDMWHAKWSAKGVPKSDEDQAEEPAQPQNLEEGGEQNAAGVRVDGYEDGISTQKLTLNDTRALQQQW